MIIYYDSKTGNVARFVNKILRHHTDWQCIKIEPNMVVKHQGHLITYTTRIGEIPGSTQEFLKHAHDKILSVSSSGNLNWGPYFAFAANLISKQYGIPILLKFELAGLTADVNNFIQKVNNLSHAD